MSKKADDVSTLSINFTNGMDIMMARATSPAVMASESVRYLFFDEPGKYPEFSGKEADSISLGEVRTNAWFWQVQIGSDSRLVSTANQPR